MADLRSNESSEEQSNMANEGNSDELERHIIKRFEIQDRLGKGAYGIVWKAYDRKEDRVVALKKIFDAFGNGQDAQRTFREVCFLTSFSVHPNIIKLTDIIRAENLNDLYLSFEYMPTDLHALIKSKNSLQEVHIRYIMAQLFRTIYFIHSANVIHRDLKPANILLTHPCEIRVADFGLARSLSDPDDNFQNGNLTNYVATRWYRSPEILLGSKRYTKGVDIWSLGTILAEMLRGRPLFTGENTIEQINFIRGALAEPTSQDLHYCDSGLVRSVFNYPPHRDFRRPLESYMRNSGAPLEAVDLIRRLLHWDPDKRIDLMKAMRHPYVQAYYDPHNVYISDIAVTPFISDDKHFEDPSIYREALYEILHAQELSKTSTTSASNSSHDRLAPAAHFDDFTLASPGSRGSISSVDYQPLQTPVPPSRSAGKTPNSSADHSRKPEQNGAGDSCQTRSIPFAQPVGAGGQPVKHAVNSRGFPRSNENQAPGRRPLEKSGSRHRIVATTEQPAVLYKTSSTGSSNNLVAQGQATSSPQRSAQQAPPASQHPTAVTRTISNGSTTGSKKAVKFEDDPPPKKVVKEKPGNGEGDGHGYSMAKRFSFDGRAIRDRLPYVKRSNSLARSQTPEPTRKFPSPSEIHQPHERKTLKEAWRDTLAKSSVPEFFKRTGSRKMASPSSSVVQHAGHLPSSTGMVSHDAPVSEPVRGKPLYSLNYQVTNSVAAGSSTTTAMYKAVNSTSVSSSVPSRPAPSDYGTLKSGMLHNLKAYGRT